MVRYMKSTKNILVSNVEDYITKDKYIKEEGRCMYCGHKSMWYVESKNETLCNNCNAEEFLDDI